MRFRLTLAALVCCATAARADYIDLYASNVDMPLNKGPRVGNSKVLVVPVQIDLDGFAPLDLEGVHTFFEESTPGRPGFNGYFQTVSSGRYNPVATVAPLVEYQGCPPTIHNASCTIFDGDVSTLSQEVDFIRDVFQRAHDEGHVDFSAFDVNGLSGGPDGVIDGAIIVVNAPGAGSALPIEYLNSGSNLNGGNGGALVLDGVQIPYCALGGASSFSGETYFEYIALHEYGHTLGFADLQYLHPPVGDLYPAWGGLHFSSMGDTDFSDRPLMPDAESRRALGWETLHVVSGTETLTLVPAGDGGGAVKLGMMGNGRKEYFLAEVRGPATTGVDLGIRDGSGNPTWGLALYHVDWSLGPKPETGEWVTRFIYCLDCNPYHPFIRNLESSGAFALVTDGPISSATAPPGTLSDDKILWQSGAISSLANAPPLSAANPYLATNYYDGTPSGIAIRDIVVNSDHSVTATFTAPEVADPCADVSCAGLDQCVSSGPLAGSCIAVPPLGPNSPPSVHASSGCQSFGAASGLAWLLLVVTAAAARAARSRRC